MIPRRFADIDIADQRVSVNEKQAAIIRGLAFRESGQADSAIAAFERYLAMPDPYATARLPGVLRLADFGRYVEIQLEEGADPQAVLKEATARLRVSRFEIVEPSLHDIFVARVTGHERGVA